MESLFKKETPVQVFSYGYCEIFKNTHFEDRLRMATSGHCIVRSD